MWPGKASKVEIRRPGAPETLAVGSDFVATSPYGFQVVACILCGMRIGQAELAGSGWRELNIGPLKFYACTDEFPTDTEGTVQEFKAAHERFFERAIALTKKKAAAAMN